MTDLEWRRARSGYAGHAGKVRLFSTQWGILRNDATPWVLRCELPGYRDKLWECSSPEQAEQMAAAIWRKWQIAVGLTSHESSTNPVPLTTGSAVTNPPVNDAMKRGQT